jgi:hypothetical protein
MKGLLKEEDRGKLSVTGAVTAAYQRVNRKLFSTKQLSYRLPSGSRRAATAIPEKGVSAAFR